MSLHSAPGHWPFASPHPKKKDPTYDREPYLAYSRRSRLLVSEDDDSDSESDADFELQAHDEAPNQGHLDSEATIQSEVSTNPALGEDSADDVRCFMRGVEGDATRLENRDQVDDVIWFMGSDDVSSEPRPERIAIVDTRGLGCWASCNRPHRGGLTESELSEELGCPVSTSPGL